MNDIQGNGEPQPVAADSPGAGFVDAIEALEDMLEFLRVDCLACVVYCDQRAVLFLPRKEQRTSVFSGIFASIIQQNGDELFQMPLTADQVKCRCHLAGPAFFFLCYTGGG